VLDTRFLGGTPSFERIDNAANNSEIDATSSAVKHIKLPQLWRAFSNAHTAHKNEANPHTQYERIDNAASNSDIDATSSAVKHIKLPQLWRAISNKLLARTIATTSPLKGGGNLSSNLTLSIDSATTSKKGAVQLTNSVTSTSKTLAASAAAVKAAYDKASVPSGAVGDVIIRPVGSVPPKFLECNGAVLSWENYSELYEVLTGDTSYTGSSFLAGGNINLVAGNDIQATTAQATTTQAISNNLDINTANKTISNVVSDDLVASVSNSLTTAKYVRGVFALPDYRGEFLRGWDHGRGVDAGRGVGSWQADEFKAHSHSFKYENTRGGGSNGASDGNSSFSQENTSVEGGTETRPRNHAVMFCIRYEE